MSTFSLIFTQCENKTVFLRDAVHQISRVGGHRAHRMPRKNTVMFLSVDVKITIFNQYLSSVLALLNVSDSNFQKHVWQCNIIVV